MALIHIDRFRRAARRVRHGVHLQRHQTRRQADREDRVRRSRRDRRSAGRESSGCGLRARRATFNEKPVRVRFAGKGDFTTPTTSATSPTCSTSKRKPNRKKPAPRAGGRRLRDRRRQHAQKLVLRDSEFGLGGRLLLTFGRKTLGEAIPPSRLGPVRRWC